MCTHAHPNVANESDSGRLRGAPVSIEAASLSQHRALIFPPPASSPCSCCSSSSSCVSQRLAHELCGRIDQLIESYCLKPRVVIEGGIYQTPVWCRRPAFLGSPSRTLGAANAHASTRAAAHTISRSPSDCRALIVVPLQLCCHCLLSAVFLIQTEFNNYRLI